MNVSFVIKAAERKVLKIAIPDIKMTLIKPSDFCEENVFFLEPTSDKNGNDFIKIRARDPNNKQEPLVLESPFLFSFGVSERKTKETEDFSGYSLPLCMWKKDKEQTEEEKEFFQCLEKIQDLCYNHLEDVYGPDQANDLNKIFYYKEITDKKGRKKRDELTPPIVYPKLIYSKKDDRFFSLFRTKEDDNVDPLKYLNKFCTIKAALLVDGIYLGENAFCLQLKVILAYVKNQKAITPPF